MSETVRTLRITADRPSPVCLEPRETHYALPPLAASGGDGSVSAAYNTASSSDVGSIVFLTASSTDAASRANEHSAKPTSIEVTSTSTTEPSIASISSMVSSSGAISTVNTLPITTDTASLQAITTTMISSLLQTATTSINDDPNFPGIDRPDFNEVHSAGTHRQHKPKVVVIVLAVVGSLIALLFGYLVVRCLLARKKKMHEDEEEEKKRLEEWRQGTGRQNEWEG